MDQTIKLTLAEHIPEAEINRIMLRCTIALLYANPTSKYELNYSKQHCVGEPFGEITLFNTTKGKYARVTPFGGPGEEKTILIEYTPQYKLSITSIAYRVLQYFLYHNKPALKSDPYRENIPAVFDQNNMTNLGFTPRHITLVPYPEYKDTYLSAFPGQTFLPYIRENIILPDLYNIKMGACNVNNTRAIMDYIKSQGLDYTSIQIITPHLLRYSITTDEITPIMMRSGILCTSENNQYTLYIRYTTKNSKGKPTIKAFKFDSTVTNYIYSAGRVLAGFSIPQVISLNEVYIDTNHDQSFTFKPHRNRYRRFYNGVPNTTYQPIIYLQVNEGKKEN